MSDHYWLPCHVDFKSAFYQKTFLSKQTKIFEVSSLYQLLDHNNFKSGFCQKTIEVDRGKPKF